MFLLQRTWTEMKLLPLVCFCLLTCSGTTFGDEEPPVTKIIVKQDVDVTLPCSFDSLDIRSDTFDWRKDAENEKEKKKEVFMYRNGNHYNNGLQDQDPQFKDRVFHFEDQLQSGNASIEIRNTKKTDSGRYSCIFPFHQPTTRSIIELIVGSSPEPSVTNLHETNDQALLQCKVQGAFPKPEVQWLDSDNNTVPAEEPQVTESEGKFNIILKTTVTKTGYYRCVSTQEEICHQVYTEIHVNLNDAASKPVITLHPVNEGVLLQCEVRGASPKPQVVWKDRAGNILPAEEPEVTENEGRYNIILRTTVTKTDYYRCVATQEEINHEVSTETYVSGPRSNTGWIVAVVVVIVIAAVVVAGAVLYLKKIYKADTSEAHKCQGNKSKPDKREAAKSNEAQPLSSGKSDGDRC